MTTEQAHDKIAKHMFILVQFVKILLRDANA